MARQYFLLQSAIFTGLSDVPQEFGKYKINRLKNCENRC